MKVHFIAVGGSVMHQLAISLKRKGYEVTGSDDEIFEPALSNLKAENILPAENGWFPAKLDSKPDAVILGMHAKADNPEIGRARELELKIYSFPEYIYQESRDKQRIIVGGSHGKTTTTSMIMHVLKSAAKDFDYLVGARLEGFDQSVSITNAPLIVCEGDEYPASVLEKRPKFHFLFPHIAILTGIAWDHINVFPSFEIYLEQFAIFIQKIEKAGILIYNQSDPILDKLVKDNFRSDLRYQPYGVPEFTIQNGRTRVSLDTNSADIMVFGEHILMNLNAAWYACRELGIGSEMFLRAIADFKGAAKRLEILAENQSTIVYRDFAHAPSKLKATIGAVKQQFPDRRLVAVFELHTFSSLNEKFLPEYRGSMDLADAAAVFYSKKAVELKRLPELDPEKIAAGFAKPGLAVINDRNSLEEWLNSQDYSHSNLLLMSSGNYDGMDILTFANRITNPD